MTVLPYFSQQTRTTCHLVAGADPNRAVLVDPIRVDRTLFGLILSHGLVISDVLITRFDRAMVQGLRTLSRIFPVTLHAGGLDGALGIPVELIAERRRFTIGSLEVEAIPVPAHSRTSLLYLIGEVLFSGAILHAGTLGETQSQYAEALLITTLREQFERVGDDTIVLPSVGPPTTVRAERLLSPYYAEAPGDGSSR